jgi:hypothetical protein
MMKLPCAVPGALKLWMGAVRMGGVLWVTVLKRDPHAPGGPVRKGCHARKRGGFHSGVPLLITFSFASMSCLWVRCISLANLWTR